MSHDHLDKILQLAYLEGAITTHGAYERAVLTRDGQGIPFDAGDIVGQLVAAQRTLRVSQTVGVFLKATRSLQTLSPQEVFSRLGISRNIYAMLEEDRISPLKVQAEVWRRLGTLFGVSSIDLGVMIRKTHQLVFFRPAFRTTLARYRRGKDTRQKRTALEQAARELFLKADLKLPSEESKRVESLIKVIAGDA
jgi:transcriptional regulator with XRE-family HTH domain